MANFSDKDGVYTSVVLSHIPTAATDERRPPDPTIAALELSVDHFDDPKGSKSHPLKVEPNQTVDNLLIRSADVSLHL